MPTGALVGARPRPRLSSLHGVSIVALLLALAALGWELTSGWRSGPPAPAGRMVLPLRGGLSVFDVSTGEARPILDGSASESVTAAAWTPDRTRITYALFHRRAEDRVSSGELFSVPASGGPPVVLVERDQPGSLVDTPAWSADGRVLFFGFQGLDGRRPVVRIDRLDVATGARAPLYQEATFPGPSPDGRELVFVRDEPGGQSLAIGAVTGGDPRSVVPAGAFKALMGPRFSRDGSRIAFTAVGPGPSAHRDESPLLAWLSVPVAEAHGEPWNMWTVRPDGTELRRIGWLQEDEPLVSWSPDGRWLGVLGTGGLWLLDANGTSDPRRIADGSFGAIDWTE